MGSQDEFVELKARARHSTGLTGPRLRPPVLFFLRTRTKVVE